MNTIVTKGKDISAITEAVTGSPTMPTTYLQDANIGLTSSPQTRTFMTITPNRVDNRYDLDGSIGPSFEEVEGKGELIEDECEVVPIVLEEDAVPDVNTQLTEEQ